MNQDRVKELAKQPGVMARRARYELRLTFQVHTMLTRRPSYRTITSHRIRRLVQRTSNFQGVRLSTGQVGSVTGEVERMRQEVLKGV